jgi:CelD/BcsL family acetyltransferase involved in cellulose biosynthesis
MAKVRIIERAEHLGSIADVWERLYRAMPEVTMFQQFELNHAIATLFEEREKLFVVCVETAQGVAIIPACVRRDCVSFIGEELFDYRDVLANDAHALDIAWREVDRIGLDIKVKAVRGPRAWAAMQPFAAAPFLPINRRLPRNKDLERNLRKLVEGGCELKSFVSGAELRSGVRNMYTLKGRQTAGSLFADPLRVEAVVKMVGLPKLHPEFHVVTRDERIAAAVLTFVDGDVCRFYGTYFDEEWAKSSPGVSLLYRVVQQAQRRGLHFDFMTGEQPYKMRFASEAVPLHIAARSAPACGPVTAA